MRQIKELVDKVKEKGVGFRLEEVMSGEHFFEPSFGPSGSQPMEFRVTWGPNHVGEWLNPRSDKFLVQELEGTVTIGGLCMDAPCKGMLELKYFDEHRIRYTFDFEVDGVEYRFVGEKVNIKPWNLPVSHTTCFGVVTETATGRLVSRSITYFRFKTAPAFLASFRLH